MDQPKRDGGARDEPEGERAAREALRAFDRSGAPQALRAVQQALRSLEASGALTAAREHARNMQSVLAQFARASANYQDLVGGIDLDGVRYALDILAKSLETARTSSYPANVLGVPGARARSIIDLAGDGITVWAVPRTEVTGRLLEAADFEARRSVLDECWAEIIDDCASEAVSASTGPYGDLAALLEQAIAVLRAGHVAASQTLAASVLETLTKVGLPDEFRADVLRHREHKTKKRMQHFDELDVPVAMVMAPLWFTYRQQETEQDREASAAFARHATVHHLRGDQISRGNATQAIMLTAALLNLLSILDEQG